MEKAILAAAFILISAAASILGFMCVAIPLYLTGMLDGFTAWMPFVAAGFTVGNFWSDVAGGK